MKLSRVLVLIACIAIGVGIYLHIQKKNDRKEVKFYKDLDFYVPGVEPKFKDEQKKKPKGFYFRVEYRKGRPVTAQEVNSEKQGNASVWKYSYDEKGRIRSTERTSPFREGRRILTYTTKEYNKRDHPKELLFVEQIQNDRRTETIDRMMFSYFYDDKARFSGCKVFNEKGNILKIWKVTYAPSGDFDRLIVYRGDGSLHYDSKQRESPAAPGSSEEVGKIDSVQFLRVLGGSGP